MFSKLKQSLQDVFLKPITVVEAVNLKSLLRLPMAAFWRMRTIFSNLGYVKLFPSETKIRELLNTSVSYLREAELSVKETLLQSSGTEKKMVSVPVLRAENLLAYIEAVFCKFCEKHSFYVDNNDEPVCIVFGGDKGETSTKFHFSIVAPGITASAYNVKIFAMYEAADTRDNIRKVLDPFFGTIKNMQQPEFRLKGHKVKVLLNGDFKNLGLLLGHQGLGATYPSIKDEVERLHLREHGDLPHTPETCQVYLRTIEEINEHHIANVTNDRTEGSGRAMAARRKLHKSIVSSPVFPTASLGNVVPPVLNIILGIVLTFFKTLLLSVLKVNTAHQMNRGLKQMKTNGKQTVGSFLNGRVNIT